MRLAQLLDAAVPVPGCFQAGQLTGESFAAEFCSGLPADPWLADTHLSKQMQGKQTNSLSSVIPTGFSPPRQGGLSRALIGCLCTEGALSSLCLSVPAGQHCFNQLSGDHAAHLSQLQGECYGAGSAQ